MALLRPREPVTAARYDRLIALGLFAVCFTVYLASPVTQMFDSTYLTAVSHSLIESGSLTIPATLDPLPGAYTVYPVEDGYYHLYPHAPAVLNVPFVLAFELFGVSVWRDGSFDLVSEVRILRVAAAFATALTVAFGYLVARLYLARGAGLALAVFFAFGTQLYSSVSRAYWSHAWGIALLTFGLYLLLAPRLAKRPTADVAAATAMAWACFCRPSIGLSALALAALLASGRRWRQLAWFVATGALWAILFVLHSYHVHGEPVPAYFSMLASGKALSSDGYWWAARGLLFSPGRGLFVYTPVFALTLLLLPWLWRRLSSRGVAAIGLVVIVGHWLVLARARHWWGGGCYGPRTFSDVVPWFLVLAALALEAFLPAARSWRRSAVAAWAAAVVLVAASLFIHARGALSLDTMRWGVEDLAWAHPQTRDALFVYERLPSWRYPQFLAGLVPVPPPRRFESWLCGGDEEVRRVSCQNRVKLVLGGSPGSAFTVRLPAGEYSSGRLDATGKRTHLVKAPAAARGRVTVLWDCGTVLTVPYDCR